MGGRAGDWIEVDGLADLWALGILAEPFRWAELEQLVYSSRVFERRLVGATLATIPHRVPRERWSGLCEGPSRQALELVRLLMGDGEAMVQKALSWAIREWTRVDPGATAAFLLAEVEATVAHADGARAWVIRDSLSAQPADVRGRVRERLAGIRRDRRTHSTSIAAGRVARFAGASPVANESVAHQGDRYARSRA
jgi:hypothetical protein